MLLYLTLFYSAALAAQNYVAEREPALAGPKEQYRLFLRTPGRDCNTWRRVAPVLAKGDYQLSESKRDLTGKEAGCKFVWVIVPGDAAGDMQFELEGITGPKETFAVPVPGAKRPAAASQGSTYVNIGGIANENGTGPTTVAPKGRLQLNGVGVENTKPEEKK